MLLHEEMDLDCICIYHIFNFLLDYWDQVMVVDDHRHLQQYVSYIVTTRLNAGEKPREL